MIIGTAGHIDHGKTALIKALTGVDADRLKEERARGITLDLGYAYWPLPDGEVLGFIDVPGHEGLVRNMLAGATGVDYALLVVAADDGPMPQTREHLAILQLLGVSRGAVVLTKIDAVAPERLRAAQREIDALLAHGPWAGFARFAVSSLTGTGIAELRSHLEQAAGAAAQRSAAGGFRLAVDRVFTLSGIGLVATGTAHSGEVRVGDRLTVSPAGLDVRVRGLHVQNRPAQRGRAGERCALNLSGERLSKETLQRGAWLVDPAACAPSQRLDVRLTLAQDTKAMAQWTAAHLHLGAGSVPARVLLLEGDTLAPGAAMRAQLVLERPLEARGLDRFVLRDPSARHTLGGGLVLDPQAPARYRRSPARLAWLAALEQSDHGAALAALLRQNGLVNLARYAQVRNLRPQDLQALTTALRDEHGAAEAGGHLLGAARRQALEATLLEGLQGHHEAHPDQLGLDDERAQRLLGREVPRAVAHALLEDLRARGRVARSGPWWHLPQHRIRLGEADAALWDRLAPLLAEHPYDPPRVRDLAGRLHAEEAHVRQTLKTLARLGEVYEVAHDHFFTRRAVARLAQILAALATEAGGVEAAAYRDRIATGRKLAIHILEFFDRIGYTRRVRDAHRLRRQGPALAELEEVMQQ